MNTDWRTLGLVAAVVVAFGASAQSLTTVSQKSRAFAPRAVTIDRGQSIIFENDDGELVHHVHSTDSGAAFDIGEQAPGTRVPVRFARSGSFAVRCLIHPRMVLSVTVR